MDYVVVASHGQYLEPRQKLVRELLDGGWPADRLVVVLNGEADEGVTTEPDGSLTVRFASNIYEYSAFFVPLALRAGGCLADDADAAFLLLHDTSSAGPRFCELARGAFARYRETGAEILWCSRTGQCNVCVFGAAAAERARQLWGDWTTLDKFRAVHMEHAAESPSIKAEQLRHVYVDQPSTVTGIEWPYASGHERTVLYFPFLDLKKFYYNLEKFPLHPNVP